MKCPKCGHDLKAETLEGIEIDRCTFCEGFFLDAGRDRGAVPEEGAVPAPELHAAPAADLSAGASRAGGGRRVPYLIDGNNLLGSWGGPAVPGDGRAEVVRRVAAFCRAQGRPRRAGLRRRALPPRPRRRRSSGRVSLRFPGRRAATPTRVDPRDRRRRRRARASSIVVTSDKPLYSYARTRGAQVLRAHEWNALAREAPPRAREGPPGGERGEKPERETDVEGWLKRFSGE